MKEKKSTTESFDGWDSYEQQTYRTGGTQPPKSHGSLIAFLLVVIIFLCGVSTALGLMNIRLFRQLTSISHEATSPVVFSRTAPAEEETFDSPLGFLGQEVTTFWQNYYRLPPGIYVTEVLLGSHAHAQGVQPGDVLISVNGIPVSDIAGLQQLLATLDQGIPVDVTFVRQGEELLLTLILE